MKLLFTLLLITPQLFSIIDSVMYGEFISIKEAPYFVGLLYPVSFANLNYCGASIISERWIITAAHCVVVPVVRVVAGESIPNKANSSTIYDVEKIFVHGCFVTLGSRVYHDIALIKLKEPIKFDEKRQPIKIRKISPQENDTVTILGLGTQGDTKGVTPALRRSQVTVVSEEICGYYSEGKRNDVFCAGNGTTDVCRGDSGGPAVINGELAGIVSYGPPCTNYEDHNRSPGVYARLDTFYDWILNVTGIFY